MDSKISPKAILPVIFLVTVIALVAPFTFRPLGDEIQMSADWRSVFSPFYDIGDNCKVAMGPQDSSLTDTDIFEMGRRIAVPFLVPYRREPSYRSSPVQHWTYVVCDVPPQKQTNWLSPQIYLGLLWGQSNVYVNGTLVRRVPTYASVSIHVEPELFEKNTTLEIISYDQGLGAGPKSLIPLVVVPTDADYQQINRTLAYFRTERPLVPLGVAGTMSVLFICCWIFGVRYRDVYWMIIASLAAAGSAAIGHLPVGRLPAPWLSQLTHVIDVLGWGAFCAAIYTFLRKPASQTKLILIVVAITALYQVQWLLPPEWIKATIGSIDRHDHVIIGFALLVLGVMSVRLNQDIPIRRYIQRRLLGGMLIVIGSFTLWAGFYAYRIGFSPDSMIRTTLIGLFGTFMIVDLVIFQRAYFEEKSLKEEEERRRSALEDRMELGFSIQRLLMPQSQEHAYGPYKISVYYERSDIMAGDWFYWKDLKDELCVICGDVVGKGPQAAIAATSVLTMCRTFISSKTTILEVLQHLSTHVARIFENRSISTIAACSLKESGQATVYNNGFAGWILASHGESQIITQRGPNLGTNPDINWDGTTFEIPRHGRLIIFSDGIAEGPRAIKKMADLAAKSSNLTTGEFIEAAIKIGQTSVVDDDKTLIVIERT
jgi:hypothetical protein